MLISSSWISHGQCSLRTHQTSANHSLSQWDCLSQCSSFCPIHPGSSNPAQENILSKLYQVSSPLQPRSLKSSHSHTMTHKESHKGEARNPGKLMFLWWKRITNDASNQTYESYIKYTGCQDGSVVRALTAKPTNLSSIPRTLMGMRTTSTSCPLTSTSVMWSTDAHTHSHKQTQIVVKFKIMNKNVL